MNPFAEQLSEARRLARELEERVVEVESGITERFDAARRQITESLNATLRRLKQAESDDERLETLADAAGAFCGRAEVFQIESVTGAPAFQAAIESMDTVVAAGTRGELSDTVVQRVGEGGKVYLFPVVVRQKTVAVLYAGGTVDVSALEMLTAFTASAMDLPAPVPVPEPVPAAVPNLVTIAPAPKPPEPPRLSSPDQQAHLRAQRFARTRIAELVLRHMPSVREGRANRALYRRLREEIDAGRDAFRRQFLETCPSMVDYYHAELVRTLAKDDASVLGTDYPGPLR